LRLLHFVRNDKPGILLTMRGMVTKGLD